MTGWQLQSQFNRFDRTRAWGRSAALHLSTLFVHIDLWMGLSWCSRIFPGPSFPLYPPPLSPAICPSTGMTAQFGKRWPPVVSAFIPFTNEVAQSLEQNNIDHSVRQAGSRTTKMPDRQLQAHRSRGQHEKQIDYCREDTLPNVTVVAFAWLGFSARCMSFFSLCCYSFTLLVITW